MAKVHLFNARKVGGPSIILHIPGRSDVEIPAEGDSNEANDELIEGAKGVFVEADAARLRKQAGLVRGLVVKE